MGEPTYPPYQQPFLDETGKRVSRPWLEYFQGLTRGTSSGISGGGSTGSIAVFTGTDSIGDGNLSGDVSTSGGTVTTLAPSGVTAGTYGDSTHVARVTVDAKGRTTAASNVAIAASVTPPGGANTDIQFNDGGAFGGTANLTFDKTVRQLTATGAAGASSPIVALTSGVSPGEVSLTPGDVEFNDILLGGHQDGSGDFIPRGDIITDIFQVDNSATGERRSGTEVNYGLTPTVPVPFTTAVGMKIVPPTDTSGDVINALHAYQYGGLGTGAIPGMLLLADRNDSGGGAAGMLGGQLKDGRYFVIWADATGAMRYNIGASLAAIRPTENGSVSDTSGNLFGTGSGTTQIVNHLFTRRGEEGRSGIPGLPGPAGATGATGATGPAGTSGTVIGRRGDDGPTRVMVTGITTGSSGSGITSLTGDVTATGPGAAAATIANSAVTLAKIANAAANSKIVGSGAAGSGSPYSELTLGTNLSMSGTTINAATGGSGNVTSTTAFGSEPGSPASGDLDLYTNAPQISRYSGTAWVPWRATPLIEPSLASWSWVNQGTATVSTTNGGIYLFDGTSGTDHIAIREFTSPGGNFTRTFGFMAYASVQGASDQFGVCFRESGSGKLVTMGMVAGSIIVAKWNSPTSFSANYSLGIGPPTGWQGAFQNPQYVVWFRLGDDGTTNRTFGVSIDGVHFLTVLSQTRTDFLTPDQLGFFVNNRSAGASTAGIGMWLLSLV